MDYIAIGDHRLGVDSCYVIAEIGSNHAGSFSRAVEMIEKCARCGVNAVKFQLFQADKLVARIDLPETRMYGQFAKHGRRAHSMFQKVELPVSWLRDLKSCSDDNNVDFLATPFDESGADILAETGVPAIKVASFELTHTPLLKHIGGLGVPVLLSTGMADLIEIELAIDAVNAGGEDRIALFHCGIGYPVDPATVNLRAMETMRRAFGCPVGYSDHSLGLSVPFAAAAMGAAMYEKHVTMEGASSPDHEFALDLKDLSLLVEGIHECEAVLGTGEKMCEPSEEIFRRRGRRSLFVTRDLKKGDLFSEDSLAVLRPGTGLQPCIYEEVLGARATKDIKAVHQLEGDDYS